MRRLPWLLALAFLCAAAPAKASLKLCNRTSYILYAATAVANGTAVDTKGWLRLAPGQCRTALPDDLRAQGYFVYARSSLAHSGPARAWGGGAQFCASAVNFSLHDETASTCQTADAFPLPFAALDTHHMRSWTMTFTESPALRSLEDAQVAGLKRLLKDNGLKAGAIGPGADKQAAASFSLFRARAHLPAKATIDDLFDALETGAMKSTSPAGYAICNDTEAPFLAALGERKGRNFTSHGWWTVAAGSCAQAITSPLGAEAFYLRVQRTNGAPLVGGTTTFCTTNVAFDIQGRTRCKERGLQETGFAETVTKGAPGYAAHVGANGLFPQLSLQPAMSK